MPPEKMIYVLLFRRDGLSERVFVPNPLAVQETSTAPISYNVSSENSAGADPQQRLLLLDSWRHSGLLAGDLRRQGYIKSSSTLELIAIHCVLLIHDNDGLLFAASKEWNCPIDLRFLKLVL